MFHHVVDVYGDQVMRFFTQDTLADLWQCYGNVNRRFRDKIVEVSFWVKVEAVFGVGVGYVLLYPSARSRRQRITPVGLSYFDFGWVVLSVGPPREMVTTYCKWYSANDFGNL